MALSYSDFVASRTFRQLPDEDKRTVLGRLGQDDQPAPAIPSPEPLPWETIASSATFAGLPDEDKKKLEDQHFRQNADFEVRREAAKQGVNPVLMASLLTQESGGDPTAVSPMGATGLMQLMSGAATDMGVDPAIPSQNVRGGVGYFKRQLETFGDEDAALAAYYAGPGRVRQAMAAQGDDWLGWLDANVSRPHGQPLPSAYVSQVRSRGDAVTPAPTQPTREPAMPTVPAPPPDTSLPGIVEQAQDGAGQMPPFSPEQFQHYLRAIAPVGTDYELEYGPGLGGMAARTAGNLASGFATLFAGLADIVPYVADTLTSDPGEYGATVQGFNEFADFMREKAQEMSPADPKFVDKAIAGLATSIGFMIPGAMFARAAFMIPKVSPLIATAIGVGAATVEESMMEGADVYDGLLKQGMPQEEAESRAHMVTAKNIATLAATNAAGGLFNPTQRSIIRRALQEMPASAVEEGLQEVWQLQAQDMPVKDHLHQISEAAALGGVIGGTMGVGMGAYDRVRGEPTVPVPPEEAPAPEPAAPEVPAAPPVEGQPTPEGQPPIPDFPVVEGRPEPEVPPLDAEIGLGLEEERAAGLADIGTRRAEQREGGRQRITDPDSPLNKQSTWIQRHEAIKDMERLLAEPGGVDMAAQQMLPEGASAAEIADKRELVLDYAQGLFEAYESAAPPDTEGGPLDVAEQEGVAQRHLETLAPYDTLEDAYDAMVAGRETGEAGTNDLEAAINWAGRRASSLLEQHGKRQLRSEPAIERQPATTPTAEEVTAAAEEAATSPTNEIPEPTEAQKQAGNYRHGHIRMHGLDISIENPRGSERSGTAPDGTPWSVTMPAAYGYIRRFVDADGEQVDVYLGDQPESDRVFVVDQRDLDTDAFDEHKAFMGFPDQAAVEQTYDAAFDDGRGPERRAAITEMSVDEFKTWLKEGDTTEPVRAEIDVVAPTAEPVVEPEADITPEQVHQAVDEAVGEGQWDTEQNPDFGTFSQIMVGTPHIDNMDQGQRAALIQQVQRGAYQAWQESRGIETTAPIPETETPIPETEAPIDETIVPETETLAAQEEIAEPAPETSGIISFDPDELLVDAQRFQYKEGGDVLGVSERLKGVKKWEPRRAGVAIVWEAKDGKRYIVDGHQRLGLAKRMKEEGQDARLNAWLLREADGVSSEEARAEAALKNIGEGTGTSVDAARIIREASPEALAGLPPTSALVSQGTSLSRLDNDLLRMVERGDVEGRYGAVIGEKAAEDPALQRTLFKLFAKKAPTSVQMAEMLADQFIASRTADETTMTLFGAETEADSLMYDRAKVLDSAVKLLNDDRRLFGTLVGKSNAIAAAGNVLDEQGNVQRKADTETVLAYVNAQANVKGPISDALTAAANDVRAGGRVKNAARKFVEAIREIPPQSQPRDVEPSGTPAPLFEEGGAPVTAPTEGTGEPGLFPGGRPEPGGQGVQREPAPEEPVEVDTQTRPMFSRMREEDIAAAATDPAVTEELTAIAQRLAPQATFTTEPELRDEAGREIQGIFETQGKEQIIRVALAGNPVESLGHESIHALKQAGLFTDAEWTGLERAAQENDWLGTFNIPDRYSDLDTAGQLEEAVASAFGRYLTEGEVAGITGEAEQPSMLRRVFDRLRTFFRDVGRALQGGDTEVSPTNIFEEIRSGERAAQGQPATTPTEQVADRKYARPMDAEEVGAATGEGPTLPVENRSWLRRAGTEIAGTTKQQMQQTFGKEKGAALYNDQYLYGIKKEFNATDIGVKVTKAFTNKEVWDRIRNIPVLGWYLGERGTAMTVRLLRRASNSFAKQFSVSKEEQETLFDAAEAANHIDPNGQIVWGTEDVVRDEKGEPVMDADGNPKMQTRFTPEDGKLLWAKLSDQGKESLMYWVTLRQQLKEQYKVESDLQGYVHHYFPSEREGDMFKAVEGILLKRKEAGARKRRKGAEGFEKDLEKSVTRYWTLMENERLWNDFTDKLIEDASEPVSEDTPLKEGWKEIPKSEFSRGVHFSRKLGAGRQVPAEFYEDFMRFAEMTEQTSELKNTVRSLGRFFKTNMLIHPGTAVTNSISGAIQYMSKIVDDFWKLNVSQGFWLYNVMSGKAEPKPKDFDQHLRRLVADITAPLEALRPSVIEKLPPELFGAMSNARTQFGPAASFMDRFNNVALWHYGAIENYWKRAIMLSELKAQGMPTEGMNAQDLIGEHTDALLKAGDVVDTYAFNYANQARWITRMKQHWAGALAFPFPTYPYKLGHYYARYIGAMNPLTWKNLEGGYQEGAARFLTLMTAMGIGMGLMDDEEKDKVGPWVPGMASALDKTGRLHFPWLDKNEGTESYVRVIKYPWLNLISGMDGGGKALQALWEDRNPAEGTGQMGEVLQEMIGEGPLVAGLAILTGYGDEFSQHKTTGTKLGELAASFVPGPRISQELSSMSPGVQQYPTNFLQAFIRGTPLPDSWTGLGKVREDKASMIDGQYVLNKPTLNQLKFWLGITIKEVDVKTYQFQKRRALVNIMKGISDAESVDAFDRAVARLDVIDPRRAVRLKKQINRRRILIQKMQHRRIKMFEQRAQRQAEAA